MIHTSNTGKNTPKKNTNIVEYVERIFCVTPEGMSNTDAKDNENAVIPAVFESKAFLRPKLKIANKPIQSKNLNPKSPKVGRSLNKNWPISLKTGIIELMSAALTVDDNPIRKRSIVVNNPFFFIT